MKTNVIIMVAAISFAISVTACENQISDDSLFMENEAVTMHYSSDSVSEKEIIGLRFMREEEKLAGDVYKLFYKMYGLNIFNNIASSEDTHTEAVLDLINVFGIDDPSESVAEGTYADTALQSLYDNLITQGKDSETDALLVGALIEETDIIDIQNQLDEFVQNEEIRVVYLNLIKGSKNHLRAFVRNLNSRGVAYSPQLLDESYYNEIIGQ